MPYDRSAADLLRPALLALLLATCALPSDESDTVYVTIDAGSRLVNRGDVSTVAAHAWRGSDEGAQIEIRGASFFWSTSDSSVARVAPGDGGRAAVTGVRTGHVILRAAAKDFEDATAAEVELRVANTVEIDRVTPDTVAFGEQVTVEGVGLGGVDRVFLGDAVLIPDSSSFLGDSSGVGSMRFWVAYPAASQRLLAVAREGFSASAPDTTVVLQHDAFETEDGTLPDIPLDGPVVRSPDMLFYNPALNLELGNETDTYRLFRSEASEPLTLVIRLARSTSLFFNAVILPPDEGIDPDWGIGSQTQLCDPFVFSIPSTPSDSIVRILEGEESIDFRLDIVGLTSTYALEVRRGRPVPDPRLEPDRFEPNDHCARADSNFEDPDRTMDLGIAATSEVLTMDHAHDLDWFRLEVPGDEPQFVTIRVSALPFGAADSSSLGTYLIEQDLVIHSTLAASPQTIADELEPGSYYLVVAEEGGVPTRYGLCVTIGTDCILPSISRAP